jgi:hypothetical protein
MIEQEFLDNQMNNGKEEYILCAAIHYDNGEEVKFKPYNIDKGYVMCGWRHPQIGFTYLALNPDKKSWSIGGVQGFLTNKNRFLTRKEALSVAINANQISEDFNGVLCSEDLW